MTEVIEQTVTTLDDESLFLRVFPCDSGPFVLVIHGLSEHGGRYQHFCEFLQKNGVGCASLDLRGHGKSSGLRGYFNSVQTVIDDFDLVITRLEEFRGKRPLFVFAHSLAGMLMSYYIAKNFNFENRSPFTGVILSSPGFKDKLEVPAILLMILPLASALFPKFRTPVKLSLDLVSRNPEIESKILADPLYYKGGIAARSGFVFKKMQTELPKIAADFCDPVLCNLAAEDAIISSSGAKELFELFGSADKEVVEYPEAYHELVNEPNHQQIFNDVLAWIQQRYRESQIVLDDDD